VTQVLGVRTTPFETALAAGYRWYQSQPRRPRDYTFDDRLIAATQ